MPLLAPVIKAAQAKRAELRQALGAARLSAWRSAIAGYWYPLPPAERPVRAGGRDFHAAIDGTGHAVQLSTGAHLIVAAAAAYGPAPVGQRDTADLQVMRGRHDFADAATARDLLMRALEADAARQAAAEIALAGLSGRAVVWIDGSLQGELAHIAGTPERLYAAGDGEDGRAQGGWWQAVLRRASAVLHMRAELLQHAERSGLLVVGLSKTQRASFFADALERSCALGTLPEDERPSDGELLAAASTAGWSHPIVLDARRFLNRVSEQASDVLRDCPAIVSCYVRPHPADLPLRVDVPASALGLPDRFLPDGAGGPGLGAPGWLEDPDAMLPVIREVMAAYGGVNVYNGPLYAVDRLVRLSRRELETRYLPICAKVVGLSPSVLSVDRGRRRFLLD